MALRKEEKRRGLPLRRITALLAAVLLVLALTGCARRCSFCGRRTILFDHFHLHGVELTVCQECQYW